jgi:Putative zinc-finger
VICRFTMDDGAYILGALSPAERAAFEQHLPQCPTCRESVAGLAVLPGLLGRLDPATAAPAVTAPPTQLARVLAAATIQRRAEQRRRTLAAIAAAVTAAMVAVLVGVGVHLVQNARPAPSAVAYSAMQQTPTRVPIEAEIALTPAEGGTWVAMRCRYGDSGSYEGRRWPVWLVVFPSDGGQAEPIGSWMATAGKEVSYTALTRYRPDQIARVELQGTDQRTLLWWRP